MNFLRLDCFPHGLYPREAPFAIALHWKHLYAMAFYLESNSLSYGHVDAGMFVSGSINFSTKDNVESL